MAYVPKALRSKSGSAYVPVGLRGSAGKRAILPGTKAERDFVRKHRGGRSVGGFLGNVGSDIGGIVLGTPGAIKGVAVGAEHSAENTLNDLLNRPGWRRTPEKKHSFTLSDVEKAIVADYAYRWGPLARGDFKTFLAHAYERPVSDLLDALTVVSGGTTGVAKVLGKSAPRSIRLRSPGAIAGREGATISEKAVVGSELGRRMRIGLHKIGQHLPREAKTHYEISRQARATQHRILVDYTRNKLKTVKREAAKRKMSADELVAANIMQDFPLASDFARVKEQLRALGDEGLPTLAVFEHPKVKAFYDNPTPKMQRYLDETAALVAHHESLLPAGDLTLEQRRYLPSLLAREAKFEGKDLVAPEGSSVPELLAEIKSEIATTGAREPIYRPHASVDDPRGTRLGSGGVGAQPKRPYKQNQGVLQAMGRVAYDLDTFSPQYMRTIKWASYVDRHRELIAAAEHVDDLPSGYIYIRRRRGEPIPYTTRTGAEFKERLGERYTIDEKALDELFDAENTTHGSSRENLLTTTDKAEAEIADGKYLAVPEHYARKMSGEFVKHNKVIRNLWDKPTDVWRAIVLNLRVGWLVNNIVGNSFLYVIKNAGPQGLAAYVRSLTPEKQVALFRFANKDKVLSKADMAEIFPDQYAGIFMSSQVPAEGFAGKVSRYAPTRPLREADVYVERSARQAYASRLANTPEVKARYKAMPKETRSWRAAARKELESNPQLVERISSEINNALGDYFSLGPYERGFVRRLVPFYAWYKAITQVMAKMPVDYPFRTAIVSEMGRLGTELESDATEGLPPWLQGSIGLPGGRVLSTQAINPMSTPYSLGRGVFADDWFAARQREGIFNPYADVIVRAIGSEGGFFPKLGHGAKDFATSLPPARIAFPPHRESYTGDDRLRELWSYLGIPIKRPAR